MKYKITITHHPEDEEFPYQASTYTANEFLTKRGATSEYAINNLVDLIKKMDKKEPIITKEIEI